MTARIIDGKAIAAALRAQVAAQVQRLAAAHGLLPGLAVKPLAQLLVGHNAMVTSALSNTRDLAAVCARADLLFAATGTPQIVRTHWVEPGATVIDVGSNRVAGAGGAQRLVGDVAFAEVA